MTGSGTSTGTGSQDHPEAGAPLRRRRPLFPGVDPDFPGVTPVPVIPSRIWRRAAWLAVAVSCVVLAVLVFAAARLPGGPFQRMDAFPGLPTGGLLTAQQPRSSAQPPSVTPALAAQDGAAASAGSPGADAGNVQGNDAGAGASGQTRSTATSTASPPDLGPRSQPGPPPVISVLPVTGHPPVDADSLVAATTTFYSQLPNNIPGAWAMVGPRMKAQGYETFRRQWADAAEVVLKKLVVDPDDSTVLATVKLATSDGTVRVQQYRMVFDRAGSLTIDEITPIAGEDDQGNEPAK